MLYQFHEIQRDTFKPLTAWAQVMSQTLGSSNNLFADNPLIKRMTAGLELTYRLGKDYEKPAWHLDSTDVTDNAGAAHTVDVFANVIKNKPFCKLLHFERDTSHLEKTTDPRVLVIAPMSGHHATLLRDTVKALLPRHEVFVTDWMDARMVPVSKGAFSLSDYVAYVMEFIQLLAANGQNIHLISVCQPTVPVMAAVSLLSTQQKTDKSVMLPRSMTMMGGPIDPRKSPTSVNNLATTKPFSWFEETVIHTVPDRYPGAGRRVYPGFLQHAGFVAMNPDRHLKSHWEYYGDLVKGDVLDADAHRDFYDEYNAVLDLASEFYLETIKLIFQEHRLPLGKWDVELKGEKYGGKHRVCPQDIKNVALFTVEGELDDISGSGQTQAAHDLCSGIPKSKKQHYTAPQCGHYGIFSGRRWREMIAPKIETFIRLYD